MLRHFSDPSVLRRSGKLLRKNLKPTDPGKVCPDQMIFGLMKTGHEYHADFPEFVIRSKSLENFGNILSISSILLVFAAFFSAFP